MTKNRTFSYIEEYKFLIPFLSEDGAEPEFEVNLRSLRQSLNDAWILEFWGYVFLPLKNGFYAELEVFHTIKIHPGKPIPARQEVLDDFINLVKTGESELVESILVGNENFSVKTSVGNFIECIENS